MRGWNGAPALSTAGLLLVAGTIAGCSGDGGAPAGTTPAVTSPPAGAPASPSTGGSEAAVDAEITVSVTGRTVTPPPGRTELSTGDRVRLTVTDDRDNELHVHGVDIERELRAGVPLTLTFTVTEPGVYPVELHEPELTLTQLVVR